MIDLSQGIFNGHRYLDKIVRPHLAKQLASLRRYGQRHATVVEDGSRIHFRKLIRKDKERLVELFRGQTVLLVASSLSYRPWVTSITLQSPVSNFR